MLDENMSDVMFMYEIGKLCKADQDLFFKSIETIVTSRELGAMKVAASYMGLMLNPEKNDALKSAIGKQLYKEFMKEGC